jgi:hypothetical protein
VALSRPQNGLPLSRLTKRIVIGCNRLIIGPRVSAGVPEGAKENGVLATIDDRRRNYGDAAPRLDRKSGGNPMPVSRATESIDAITPTRVTPVCSSPAARLVGRASTIALLGRVRLTIVRWPGLTVSSHLCLPASSRCKFRPAPSWGSARRPAGMVVAVNVGERRLSHH